MKWQAGTSSGDTKVCDTSDTLGNLVQSWIRVETESWVRAFQGKHYCQIIAAAGVGESGRHCTAMALKAMPPLKKLCPPGHCGHLMGTCGQFRPTLHSMPGHYLSIISTISTKLWLFSVFQANGCFMPMLTCLLLPDIGNALQWWSDLLQLQFHMRRIKLLTLKRIS